MDLNFCLNLLRAAFVACWGWFNKFLTGDFLKFFITVFIMGLGYRFILHPIIGVQIGGFGSDAARLARKSDRARRGSTSKED